MNTQTHISYVCLALFSLRMTHIWIRVCHAGVCVCESAYVCLLPY